MNQEIVTLVDQARNDELPIYQQHAAFAELVHRFEESAFAWSLERLRDPDEARDATQDAFVTAWLKLRQLREPAAFGAWLKRLIVTQCNRRLRKRPGSQVQYESGRNDARPGDFERRELQKSLLAAMSGLSESEYRVVVLFYFLGRRIDEIARILGLARGTVGKRLHLARIAIRRRLPRAVRNEFVQLRPSRQFSAQVREGLFNEYLGEYRFEQRPDLIVRIEREGDQLVSYGGEQRTVLASIREGVFMSTDFDGEGRFQRDRAGRVVQFIYYEFGARLGIARKVAYRQRGS